MPMKTSERGRALIQKYEGLRLTSYRDAVGVWTIGYGRAATGGFDVRKGMKITKQQAEQFLIEDLQIYERGVERAIGREIPQLCFDACVSLAYNIGVGAFAKSSVCREIKRRRMQTAATKFGLWVKAGGRTLRGLVRRRAEEAALFLEGANGDTSDDVIVRVPLDQPRGKTPAASTTNIAAGVSAVAGVTAAGREIVDNTSTMMQAAPWIVVCIVIAGATWWIWRERNRKSREDGI